MEATKRVDRSALVVGGGLAGMQASLLLAATGVQVYLVERGPAIGGHQPLLDKSFPTDSCGLCFMSPGRAAGYCPFVECERNERISLLTLAEVVGLSGEPGDFSVQVRLRPRGVRPESCTGCGRCSEACPVLVRADFGGGLEQRKAIYRPFPQAVPDAYLVDRTNCNRCRECVKACPVEAIDLDEAAREESLRVGAVILAPGFKAADGGIRTEYGYGVYANVITGIQMERMLSLGGPTGGRVRRPSDGAAAERVAFIQCVGSRDPSRGRNYCSSICCMYAAKQVALLKGESPDASVVVFQRDRMAVGKGHEGYVERVEALPGVEYRRSAVGGVKQVPGRRDLLVSFVDPDGVQREERFDLVVLSVGMEPSDGVRELAGRLGLPLNRFGFLESDPLLHAQTPLAGIFVAGGGREPMDVADAVAEGAAAAMEAASLLRVGLAGFGPDVDEHPAGESQTDSEEAGRSRVAQALGTTAAPADLGLAVPRVGVLLCGCGGEIGGRLDLAGMADSLAARPEVVYAVVADRLCETEAVDVLRESLRRGANRLVVAACARRRIEEPLRRSALEAGLEPGLLELVNLREQCVWVHPAVMLSGAKHLPDAETLRFAQGDDVVHSAGATAKAESLLAVGIARVTLAEAVSPRSTVITPTALVVGGGAAGMAASCLLAEQGVEVWLAERETELGGDLRRSVVALGEESERRLLEGLLGGVEGSDRIHVLAGVEVNRVEGHLGAFETTVRLDGREERISHSVVLLATGVEEAQPGGYLLGEHPAVMTLGRLDRALTEEGWAERHPVVAMLLCAGLPEEGGYCSRSCCAEAVAAARRITRLNPAAEVYLLFREMRSYGFFELEYEAARREGIVFLRYDPRSQPEFAPQGGAMRVSVKERGLGREVEIDADALVLAAGVEARPVELLASSLGVAVDRHGFLVEANVKARTTEAGRPGVFLCGSCQSPRSLADTVTHAKAAAMRALALLRPGVVTSPTTAVGVNERICSGCGLCVGACSYGARVLDPDRNVSRVVDLLCQGCGGCAAVCPNGATQQREFTGRQMVAVLDAALD
ncbi:MAG: FAD-dependent oxidoreductase [Chloroflexota bacterium]